mgnify:CR=1 FL=1
MPDAVRPLRVAIVGSGPAGFYAADALLKNKTLPVEVDMFERLIAPFGLVRSGVAPDHQKIKRAAKAFERTAADPLFRLLGNVQVGVDVSVGELLELYDQVLLSVGSSGDRKLGIPGEALNGSHAATAFVGWYNGHPSFAHEEFDLSCQRAIVVGMGNVAMDVARLLVRRTSELAETDIAAHAHRALEASRVEEVVLLGRRGPAEAAFDLGELQDIAGLEGVDVRIEFAQLQPALDQLDTLSAGDRRKVEFMAELAARPPKAGKVVRMEFLASPTELTGTGKPAELTDTGKPAQLTGSGNKLSQVKIERNRLVERNGQQSAQGTGEYLELEAGLVFRSIGYAGVPLPGVPFDEKRGVIPNQEGRVVTASGETVRALYVAGWIKRGPSGVIGTNKPDSAQTAQHMLADAAADPARRGASREVIDGLLSQRGLKVTTYADWEKVDRLELERGQTAGKLREKFLSNAEMLEALRK